ncbi:MAG: TonB-dependent receptor [Proteobacteria bacterium]|nr:TonB-dependent receptor [Pseudomonadota bacterium]
MHKPVGMGGLATLLLVSAIAHAGDSGAGEGMDRDAAVSAPKLEEIVVTAQKRTQNLQEVPISISVLTEDMIEKRSMVSLSDFIKYVPGVTYSEFAPGNNSIAIRGIGGEGDRSTAMYLGEMPLTALGTLNDPDVKLVDIERIEVLRGPQGTLYGAGSMGGAIRYIPNAPDASEFSGRIEVGYSQVDNSGSDSKYTTGVVNLPLVKDKLALRVVGFAYDNAGYIDYVGNTIPSRVAFADAVNAELISGDDGGASQYTGGRATLLWKPTENFDATLTYVDQEIDQTGSFEDSLHLPAYQDYPMSFGSRTEDGKERRYISTQMYNLTMNLALEKFDLISSTSRVEYDGNEARDISRDLPFPIGALSYADTQADTQELRARSKFDGSFNFLAGLYYQKNVWNEDSEVPWIADPSTCCFGFGTDPNDLYVYVSGDTVKQKAVFTEIYYDFAEKFRLTVGGRYFSYDRERFTFTHGALNGGASGSLSKDSRDGSTAKANLTYTINPDQMVYAQWAQGFRLGFPQTPPIAAVCDLDNDGILDGTNTPINTDHVDPDSLDSLELGSKSTLWSGRWVLNAAAYHITWKKIPGSSGIPTCGIGLIVNAGEAKSLGMEVESTLFLTPQLILNAGVSVIDAEYTENAAALGKENGDDLTIAPFQGNVGLQYNFDLLGHPGFVRGDYAYVDSYVIDDIYELGGYSKVDFRAGLEIGPITAALYGTNLTNEDALIFENFGNRAWHLMPRVIGVEFGYQF